MTASHDLYGLEIFHLNYYGVNVFLCVGLIEEDSVYVFELDTKKDGRFEELKYNYKTGYFKAKPNKKCLVVPRNKSNCFSGKALEICPQRETLPIHISYNSSLYDEAVNLGEYPIEDILVGTVYATMIADGSYESYQELANTRFENVKTTNSYKLKYYEA